MSFRDLFWRLFGFPPVPQNGLEFVDHYLEQWARFAEGRSVPKGFLGEAEATFEEELTQLLRADDSSAPSRAVFFAVVQVGRSIRANSDLGIEIRKLVGPDYESTKEDGTTAFFAGNLFLWWREHRTHYPRFQLLERWEDLPTSQSIIRAYEHIGQNRKS